MTDRIEIRGLRVTWGARCVAEERERAQPFSVDIVAWVDMEAGRRASTSPTPSSTGPGPRRSDVVGGRSYPLLEALAGRLADALLIVDPRIDAVEVTVRKLRPPLALDVGSTGVRVRRAR